MWEKSRNKFFNIFLILGLIATFLKIRLFSIPSSITGLTGLLFMILILYGITSKKNLENSFFSFFLAIIY